MKRHLALAGVSSALYEINHALSTFGAKCMVLLYYEIECAKEGYMDRTISYTVDELHNGMAVREFLKSMHFSSQIISDLKHASDGIMHNGHRAYVSEKIEPGDDITVNIHEISSSEKIPPVEMELEILYEDEDLIIVNKPADMPVHPSLNNYENTLANGLAYYYESQGEKFVFRCMNRLDRNTTGAVLVAKNALSGAILSEMIRKRQIEKEYVALTEGVIEGKLAKNRLKAGSLKPTGINTFTVDAPIGRVDGSTIERCIDYDSGERAVTHVTVLKSIENNIDSGNSKDLKIDGEVADSSYPKDLNADKSVMGDFALMSGCSLVSCELETGRTHQIRVHMSAIGHPLVGDGLYNPKYQDDVMHRQLLHCRKLAFVHPISYKQICVEAPYPDDMKELIECQLVQPLNYG